MADTEFTTEELAAERWLPVRQNNGLYVASNLGRLRRTVRGRNGGGGRPFVGNPCFDGYLLTRIVYRAGRVETVRVHALVYEAFVGPVPPGMEINHIDGNKRNNRITNLEAVTHRENCTHASRTLLMSHGEAHYRASLNAYAVRAMRAEYATGATYATLARHYGVSPQAARSVIIRRTWAHVL